MPPIRLVFYGGRQAGVVGLLTCLAAQTTVVSVVPVDDPVREVAQAFGLPVFAPPSLNRAESQAHLASLVPDLLVCVHGRQILKPPILRIPRMGCINVHPCLSMYKGADPIGRLLADGGRRASVGVHWMTEEVDQGPVIVEQFIDLGRCTTPGEVYNQLYPVYATALQVALVSISSTFAVDAR